MATTELTKDDLLQRAERMGEIAEEMKELLREAKKLVRGTQQQDHAEAYVLAHLAIAISPDHGYLSRDPNLQELAEALEAEANGDDDQ